MLTYYIYWPLSWLTSKRHCFIVAHNIRPKFGSFGTRSVSLPKPSASAECHHLTFGPSLVIKQKMHTQSVNQNDKNSCRLSKAHQFSLQLYISGCFDQVLENVLLSMTKNFIRLNKLCTSKCCRRTKAVYNFISTVNISDIKRCITAVIKSLKMQHNYYHYYLRFNPSTFRGILQVNRSLQRWMLWWARTLVRCFSCCLNKIIKALKCSPALRADPRCCYNKRS